jgi:hypothetical protein
MFFGGTSQPQARLCSQAAMLFKNLQMDSACFLVQVRTRFSSSEDEHSRIVAKGRPRKVCRMDAAHPYPTYLEGGEDGCQGREMEDKSKARKVGRPELIKDRQIDGRH